MDRQEQKYEADKLEREERRQEQLVSLKKLNNKNYKLIGLDNRRLACNHKGHESLPHLHKRDQVLICTLQIYLLSKLYKLGALPSHLGEGEGATTDDDFDF